MKKGRWNPGWPGSRDSKARQRIRQIRQETDRKITAIHDTAERAISEIRDKMGAPVDIIAGEWYMAVRCRRCVWPIPLCRDPTQGKVGFAGEHTFRLTCPRPECHHEGEYVSAQIMTLQAREDGSLPGPSPLEYRVGREVSSKPWVIGPVTWCADFIANQTAIATVLAHSLTALPLVYPLVNFAADELRKKAGRVQVDEFIRLTAQLQGMGDKAKELQADDYALVNGHALIAVWGALETCIEDTIVLILMNDAQASRDAAGLVKVTPDSDRGLNEDEARRTLRRLTARYDKLHAVDQYDLLFDLFGIARRPKNDHSSAMKEINALRNSLLHRGGIIDEKLIKDVPRLRHALGSRIKISQDEYMRHFGVLCDYVQEFMRGVFASRFITYTEAQANPDQP